MAGSSCENNGTSGVTAEDDELMMFKTSALQGVTFRIVRNESDLETTGIRKNSFNPEMAHQIFDENEIIFGYQNLSINLYYLHNSAKCYVDVKHGKKINIEGCEPDDILGLLNCWLPGHYRTRLSDFLKDLAVERHDEVFGEVIDTYSVDKEGTYKVTKCNTEDEEFREFHQRFETFIIWFIDGANFIDLDDPRWLIYYIYQDYHDDQTGKKYCSPIGFCTVYNFFHFPNLSRPRISQFFILPTHQRRGLGTKLYKSVFKSLVAIPEIQDITVETPTPLFQRIRDYCDGIYVNSELKARNITAKNDAQCYKFLRELKFGQKQAQRIIDILGFLPSAKVFEYNACLDKVRTRIAAGVEKDFRAGSKRRRVNVEMDAVNETLDKKELIKAECEKYIASLEWPVQRIKKELRQ